MGALGGSGARAGAGAGQTFLSDKCAGYPRRAGLGEMETAACAAETAGWAPGGGRGLAQWEGERAGL